MCKLIRGEYISFRTFMATVHWIDDLSFVYH
jgi:hypothetical protein